MNMHQITRVAQAVKNALISECDPNIVGDLHSKIQQLFDGQTTANIACVLAGLTHQLISIMTHESQKKGLALQPEMIIGAMTLLMIEMDDLGGVR